MIQVSRLNGKTFIVNCDLIKFVEATPDTIITLVENEKLIVRESVEEIIQQTIDYKKRLFQEPFTGKAKG